MFSSQQFVLTDILKEDFLLKRDAACNSAQPTAPRADTSLPQKPVLHCQGKPARPNLS